MKKNMNTMQHKVELTGSDIYWVVQEIMNVKKTNKMSNFLISTPNEKKAYELYKAYELETYADEILGNGGNFVSYIKDFNKD